MDKITRVAKLNARHGWNGDEVVVLKYPDLFVAMQELPRWIGVR